MVVKSITLINLFIKVSLSEIAIFLFNCLLTSYDAIIEHDHIEVEVLSHLRGVLDM